MGRSQSRKGGRMRRGWGWGRKLKMGLFCKKLQKGLTACFEMLEDSVDLRSESMTQA
jgi:hypothetical protein